MKPNPKTTIPEITPIVRDYYAMDGNAVGGNFHIVLDDGNIELSSIHWCCEQAARSGDTAGMILGWQLMKLTISQRRRLVLRYGDYAA